MRSSVVAAFLILTSTAIAQDSNSNALSAWPELGEMAIRGGNYLKFKHAIDANPTAVNGFRTAIEGKSLLHLSAAKRHQEGVFILITAGADVNAKDNSGRTPLMEALTGDEKNRPGEDAIMIVEMLIRAGADPNAIAADGTNALYLSLNARDKYVTEFLLRSGARVNPPGAPTDKLALTRAWRANDDAMVHLLQNPPRVATVHRSAAKSSSEKKMFNRKFDQAVVAGDFDAIDEFLRQGVDINQQNDDGETSLYYATHVVRPDIVAFLLAEGADPNIAQKDGRTPLMESTRFFTIHGHRMVAMYILAGSSLTTVDKEGWTPLSSAVICSNVIAAKLLAYVGADANVRTPKGSLMQAALASGWLDTISFLKELGLPEETRPKEVDQAPAIAKAARANDLEGVKAELNRGASPSPMEVPNLVGEAFMAHHFEMAGLLLSHGANINYQDKHGWGPLFYMAAASSQGGNEGDAARAAEVIVEMAKRGANVNMQTDDGTTPLMISAKYGITYKNTQALLEAGANVNSRNNKGQTPLAIARQFGHKEMIQYLEAHGGVE